MNFFAPLIVLLLLAVLIWVYSWQLIVAIAVACISVPFAVLFLAGAYELLAEGSPLLVADLVIIAGLFAFIGFALYLVFIAPAYYLLRHLNAPFHITFPALVVMFNLGLFVLLAEQAPIQGYVLAPLCGLAHAWIILWLMRLLPPVRSKR
ncbi:hypothetical protein [Aliidiomarina minuta]|nr:hypothetical protein [Aliidiomarina minuta]